MSTITNFATLKTEVAAWLNKTNLTTAIPGFVQIAESNIRRDLEVRTQELVASGALAGATLDFPARFASVRRLTVGGHGYEYLTPEAYQDKDDRDSSGRWYTIIGEDFHILNGASGDAYELVYTEWFAALSADDDTNWVLTNSSDIYLWGSCMAGAIWLKDRPAAEGYKSLYEEAVSRLKAKEKEAKWSGVPLVVRPDTYER